MGLYEPHCQSLHARIHPLVLPTFQTPIAIPPPICPHQWQKPTYGARVHWAPSPDDSPALDLSDTKRVQQVLGVLLYYGRAVDSTLLTAITEIATQQAHATERTLKAIVQLLNYCATHPNAILRYRASDMVLWIDSDASYLSVPKARSRVAGYFFLSDKRPDDAAPPDLDEILPRSNGAVLVLCKIAREVLSSAAEAELAASFYNAKEAVPLRQALEEMGHPQPPTPLQTDNSTATGIANDTIKQKHSKAIDMRFYWIQDRVRQGHFHVFWRKGSGNKADYFTKHHPPSHHQAIRSDYLRDPSANFFACLDMEDDEPGRPT